jgi:uncharacterized damage-inducible protein DinB
MKSFLTLFFLAISFFLIAQDDVFVIDPLQSMVMTGKDPGQDGAINPYMGQECTAVVENLGKNEFRVRVQENGRIKKEIAVSPGEEKEIALGTNDELYIDTDKKAKTRLNFKPNENIADSIGDELFYDLPKMMQSYSAYNYWADQQLAEWISSSTKEMLTQEIESSFSSIKETILHIWSAEYLWLQVVKDESPKANPAKTFEGSKEELFDGWLQASEKFSNHVKSLSSEELQIRRPRSNAEVYTVIANLIQHCMNHSTYHRGQLITMGRQAGLSDPPRTDYLYYISLMKE